MVKWWYFENIRAMSQGKETTSLIISLLVTAVIAVFGYRFLSQQGKLASVNLDTSQPNPSVIKIDGSIQMTDLIKELRHSYSQVTPSISTTFGLPDGKPNGSSKALDKLKSGEVDIVVSSSPIELEKIDKSVKKAETEIALLPIAKDAIAVVVGANNPFKGSLTRDQLRYIYQGKITNWSEIGGANKPIKVINISKSTWVRPYFDRLVLLSDKSEELDSHTSYRYTTNDEELLEIFSNLGSNGIGYTSTRTEENAIDKIFGLKVIWITYYDGGVASGIISTENPLKSELTEEQVRDIYQGKINNWKQIGGANQPIRVFNRSLRSEARKVFQNVVLGGKSFAPDSANFITYKKAETTDILRRLGDDGISFVRVSEAEKQEEVRIVPIAGVNVTDVEAIKSGKYPLSGSLFLAVKKSTSPDVKQFIDFVFSPQGQQIIQRLGYILIQ